jgi:hypothetical protein
MRRLLILGSILLLVPFLEAAQEVQFLREDFNDLKDWRPLNFPNIGRHTRYTIVTKGHESYLKAESNASASGLVLAKEFNVYEYPRMRWRWKVDNVYRKGDVHTQAGDDYPMRLYVLFKNDSDQTGPMDGLGHSVERLMFGKYLPHSSLNYIWASRETTENIVTSPYTNRVKMILIEKGATRLGRWLEEQVDIVKDYERAFHQKPPETAELAIMNDSDNTGESSVSYIDWIEIFK